MIFCKNLDKRSHIVSENIMVHKGLRILVFLSEATLSFLAYFQYAYVRALSVRPSVRPSVHQSVRPSDRLSVLATSSHGVGRSCSFMAR